MSVQRILFIHDPRRHHMPEGAGLLGELLTDAGMEVTATDAVSAVAKLASGAFDVVALYTQGDTFLPQEVETLSQYVRNGGGLLGIHSATATNKTDDAYAKLIGSRFIGHGPVLDYEVTVSDPDHPIVHRVQNFHIRDELYMLKPFSEFRTFLTGWWNGKPQPLGYTKEEGKGRVAYLANGHDPAAMSSKAFQKLVVRAARWAAGENWSEKTIKVAAIGYGGAFNMGKVHLESCKRARMNPVAVCDLDPKRTATAKEELGQHIQAFNSVEELLSKSDAEMCIVITPHNTHARLCVQCLESGRHVVTEKPFTITVDEATRVIEAANRAKKMATVFHNRRWDGDFLTMRRLIEKGTIGDVFHIECFFGGYSEPTPTWWRSYKDIAGGAMHDWGAHFVDWLLQLMPHKIESVAGDFNKRMWHRVSIEDHTVAHVRFEGGRTATLEQSSIAAIGKSRFRILGTLGGIEQRGWDAKDGIDVVRIDDGQKITSNVPCAKSDWDGFYRNVADHLLLGEELAVTAESARRVIAVIDLAEQSSKQGGVPLKLPFDQ
jgi:predicted dehydrogenase/type 1 glutamine amidotransferase